MELQVGGARIKPSNPWPMAHAHPPSAASRYFRASVVSGSLLLSQPERRRLRRSSRHQHHNAAQRTAMSTSQARVAQHQRVTPPQSLIKQPLTPPSTDKKLFAGALRVIALFKDIQQGRHTTRDTQIEFKLAEGEYDYIERTLQQDDELWGFAQNKIRFVSFRHPKGHS
jgi:hypothetical protein